MKPDGGTAGPPPLPPVSDDPQGVEAPVFFAQLQPLDRLLPHARLVATHTKEGPFLNVNAWALRSRLPRFIGLMMPSTPMPK